MGETLVGLERLRDRKVELGREGVRHTVDALLVRSTVAEALPCSRVR